jgi:diaminohydroxyphosphoribosylaminopyrimidine deaminase/5-amino-6-(5-phosphoribosylamino)uracil reductase
VSLDNRDSCDTEVTHSDARRWLAAAIELSRRCPPSDRAYAVGALVVDAGGEQLAYGYSRETDPLVHAEESALAKLAGSAVDLRGATLYTSLEPCSRRASRPCGCAQLIVAAGVGRVVLAWREPALFVPDARGVEMLIDAGVEVVELPELADAACAVNAHLIRRVR